MLKEMISWCGLSDSLTTQYFSVPKTMYYVLYTALYVIFYACII